MGLEHALAIQLPPQLVGVGDWDHLSQAVFKASVQNLVTRDRSCRRVIPTAKGEEKPDHVLRVAGPPLMHVDRDPRCDVFLAGQKKSTTA